MMRAAEAEGVLLDLASVFFQNSGIKRGTAIEESGPNVETRYRALVEQIPAVVFMAYLDEGIGEAYVSPQIEKSLGFSQAEWLEDPVRWYQQIHPDDKDRWSVEAARMFVSGEPLRSAYRVLSRDGRVIWFHCEAKMIRRPNGRPWFIHGAGFDITELKRTEAALAKERDTLSAILNTVGALVAVLDADGRIVQFNRACERTTGYRFPEVEGKLFHEMFAAPEESERFAAVFERLTQGAPVADFESHLATHRGERRLIHWSTAALPGEGYGMRRVIATGIDITEHKRLENAVLEVSNSEQRRIGQDLHDGLGQHLTGIAFMSKALEQKLADQNMPEAAEAGKIVNLVNEGIHKTRVLARGLLPHISDALGLMSALQHLCDEVEDVFRVKCSFDCPDDLRIDNDATTNHLYRIAQEAAHNAIRHGRAKNIVIELTGTEGRGLLRIGDDGCGIRKEAGVGRPGMGLSIMRYRAGMIGATLEISPRGEQGTEVRCVFPY